MTTATLEKEVKALRREVWGIRSLLMEIADPDFGLELAEPIKDRITRARKAGRYVSLADALREIRK